MLIINIFDAAHGDCILLDFSHTLILIDSGPKEFLIRRNIISKLKELVGERVINIAIVTHNDDDHIGGYEYILSSGIKIDKLLFNSLSYCRSIFNTDERQISYSQDVSLETFLRDKDISVEAFLGESEPIKFNNIKLIPLTPSVDALQRMNNNYLKKSQLKISQPQISSDKEVEPTLEEYLEEIANGNDKFIPDRSITNRTSLSIIVEYNGFRALFLGDAWAKDVIEALSSNQIEPNFNVVKLSHHGSEKNTNSELIKILGKTEYIICADKSKHNHPNNKTIARVLTQFPEAIFHFSSDNEEVRSIFKKNSVLEFKALCTYSSNGVNIRYYECK
ncbi:ComEC/Rec2 family competence protein [Providencia rettgeri]|uniref:ComEC/Rec2 family competence protein n=1 Tax=Providencia rettgeri TaxID=587 RepID=UPI003525F583